MDTPDLEFFNGLLKIISEHKVSGIYVFFVFFIYRLINKAYSSAKKDYREVKAELDEKHPALNENEDETIADFRRKATIHNVSLLVIILGFSVIFFFELYFVSGQHHKQRMALKGLVKLTNIESEHRDDLIKMLSQKIELHYDDIDIHEQITWIGVENYQTGLKLELEFVVVVPQYASDKLDNAITEIGLNPVMGKKLPAYKNLSSEASSLKDIDQYSLEITKYKSIYLKYDGDGRYDFCDDDGRVTIRKSCENELKSI